MYGSLKKIHIVCGKIYINNMHFLKATKHDNCDVSYEPLALYCMQIISNAMDIPIHVHVHENP